MPAINPYSQEEIPTPFGRLWHSFCAKPLALVGLWLVMILLFLTLFGPMIAPFSPQEQNTQALLQPPSWDPAGTIDHFLGTDDLGRDIFSRLLHGAQLTFGIAVIIVIIALLLGFVIGSLSGMMKGLKSSILGHLLDAFLSIPSLLLAILIVAVIGPGLNTVFWAVGLALVPQFIRAIHQAVHEEKQKEYVTAARLDGANLLQVFWFVIMPNVWETVVLQTTFALSAAILDIAVLGFLSLGAQTPSSEWGAMVVQGSDNLLFAPWAVVLPSLAIFLSVLAINLVGDGLRAALAPGGN